VNKLHRNRSSPTADATRFTDPWRTSPATKTPGTLDSSRNGLPFSRQLSGSLPSVLSPAQPQDPYRPAESKAAANPFRRRADKHKNRGRELVSPAPAQFSPSAAVRPIASKTCVRGSNHNIGCAFNLID